MALSDLDARDSERSVVAAAQRGERSAFDDIFRLYRRRVLGLCFTVTGDRSHAEDMVQETFARAFGKIHTFKPDLPLWPWLATIARHVCVDDARARRRARTVSLDEHDEELAQPVFASTGLDHADVVDLRIDVARAIAELAPRERRFFLLHSVENLTFEEIARAHGSTAHAVRNVTWRARATLREALAHARAGLGWLWPATVLEAIRRSARRSRALAEAGLRSPLVLCECLGSVIQGAGIVGLLFMAVSAPAVGSAASMARTAQIGSVHPATSGNAYANQERHRAIEANADVVRASVESGKSNHGSAAPSSGRVVVEAFGTRTEARYDCGSPGAGTLPKDGPIRAIC